MLEKRKNSHFHLWNRRITTMSRQFSQSQTTGSPSWAISPTTTLIITLLTMASPDAKSQSLQICQSQAPALVWIQPGCVQSNRSHSCQIMNIVSHSCKLYNVNYSRVYMEELNFHETFKTQLIDVLYRQKNVKLASR